MNVRWALSGGVQGYNTKRQVYVKSSGMTYHPQSTFNTYSVNVDVEAELLLLDTDKAINVSPIIGIDGVYVMNKEIEETDGGAAALIVKAGNNMRLNAVAGLRLNGEIAKTKWRLEIKGGLIAIGGYEDFTYDMAFKEGKDFGSMNIRGAQEDETFAIATFGIEKEISERVSLYGAASIMLEPERKDDIVSGYSGGVGMNYRFGAKNESQDWEKIYEQKEKKKEEAIAEAQAKEEEAKAAQEARITEEEAKGDAKEEMSSRTLAELRIAEEKAKKAAQKARLNADHAGADAEEAKLILEGKTPQEAKAIAQTAMKAQQEERKAKETQKTFDKIETQSKPATPITKQKAEKAEKIEKGKTVEKPKQPKKASTPTKPEKAKPNAKQAEPKNTNPVPKPSSDDEINTLIKQISELGVEM
jgi:hypothetical protein